MVDEIGEETARVIDAFGQEATRIVHETGAALRACLKGGVIARTPLLALACALALGLALASSLPLLRSLTRPFLWPAFNILLGPARAFAGVPTQIVARASYFAFVTPWHW